MMAFGDIRDLKEHIGVWATTGFSCDRRYDLDRPQTLYPKTICMIWLRPTIGGRTYEYACLDVHYDRDDKFRAIGGFWIKDVDGDLKPQQDSGGLFDKFPISRTYDRGICDSNYRNFMKRLAKGKAPIQPPIQASEW